MIICLLLILMFVYHFSFPNENAEEIDPKETSSPKPQNVSTDLNSTSAFSTSRPVNSSSLPESAHDREERSTTLLPPNVDENVVNDASRKCTLNIDECGPNEECVRRGGDTRSRVGVCVCVDGAVRSSSGRCELDGDRAIQGERHLGMNRNKEAI